MFEYDASTAMRLEMIEAAITALYETVPHGHEARGKLVELIQEKIRTVGFAHERRHQLEHILTRIQANVQVFDNDGQQTP